MADQPEVPIRDADLPRREAPPPDPLPNRTTDQLPRRDVAPPPAQQPAADLPPAPPPEDKKWLKDRLNRAKDTGRRAVLADMEREAKEMGFDSLEAMKAFAKEKKTPPAEPPRREPPLPAQPRQARPAQPSETETQLAQERDRERTRAANLERDLVAERQRAARLEKQSSAKEVEFQVREAAVQAGVSDVDLAMDVLKRKIRDMTDEEAAAFDHDKYFKEELKAARPYLYGIVERPAHTGTGVPPPGQPPPPRRENNGFDARRAKPDEVRSKLREWGLNGPSA